MADNQAGPNPSSIRKVRTFLGGILGVAVGSYCGLNFLIPFGIAAAAWWVGKRILSPTKLAYLPALAIQIGHLGWVTFGLAYLGVLDLSVIDVLVLVVGVTWLALKPGLGPIIFLTVFQILAFGVNAMVFIETQLASNDHKALLVHLILRASAVFLMWRAYYRKRAAVAVETATASS